MRAEVNEVLSNSNKLGITELQRLHYVERCIKEALRLYPSVPFISRNIHQDLQLSNSTCTPIIHHHLYICMANDKTQFLQRITWYRKVRWSICIYSRSTETQISGRIRKHSILTDFFRKTFKADILSPMCRSAPDLETASVRVNKIDSGNVTCYHEMLMWIFLCCRSEVCHVGA